MSLNLNCLIFCKLAIKSYSYINESLIKFKITSILLKMDPIENLNINSCFENVGNNKTLKIAQIIFFNQSSYGFVSWLVRVKTIGYVHLMNNTLYRNHSFFIRPLNHQQTRVAHRCRILPTESAQNHPYTQHNGEFTRCQ